MAMARAILKMSMTLLMLLARPWPLLERRFAAGPAFALFPAKNFI